MIKCIISDLGNVLIRFDNTIFYKNIAEFTPFTADEIGRLAHANLDLSSSFEAGKISADEFFSRASRILQSRISQENFFRIYNNIFSLDMPVVRLLQKLGLNYKLMLLSNTDEARFGFIKERFPQIQFFHDYMLSYRLGYVKPQPHIFQLALHQTRVRASACVFIDDLPENITAAAELGIRTILFRSLPQLETELLGLGLVF